MDPRAFERLHPGQRVAFEFPAQHLCNHEDMEFGFESLSVVVLDAVAAVTTAEDGGEVECVAMLVPRGKEHDWVYCSEGGQWQLLASAGASRMMILQRNWPSATIKETVHHVHAHGLGCKRSADFWKGNQIDYLGNTEVHGESAHLHTRVNGAASARALHVSVGGAGREDDLGFLHNEDEALKSQLPTLVVALAPRICFQNGVPAVPFVSYTDDVVRRVVVEEAYSPLTGLMVVEDVALDDCDAECAESESLGPRSTLYNDTPAVCRDSRILFRRRLRFKRMPNLIQTEVALIFPQKPHNSSSECARRSGDEALKALCDEEAMAGAQVDHSRLVHKYLPPIAAGLVLAAPCIESCMERGKKAKVLALGIGGGALPNFLHQHFGFHVQAVDVDNVVLDLARRHFGLRSGAHMKVEVGDALQTVAKLAAEVATLNAMPRSSRPSCKDCAKDNARNVRSVCGLCDPRVHVIVVDVDEGDARLGLSSPPSSFLEPKFLVAARTVLHEGGVLAMNVVPAGGLESYRGVVAALRSVFEEVYETAVEGDVNRVVFALPARGAGLHSEGPLAGLLKKFVDVHLLTKIHTVSFEGFESLLESDRWVVFLLPVSAILT